MATRCFWPPDNWLGMKVLRSESPTRSRRLLGAVVALLAADALVIKRQRDVFRRILEWQQVEGLEDETQELVAQPRGLRFAQVLDRVARELIAAGVVAVEDAQDVQQRQIFRIPTSP